MQTAVKKAKDRSRFEAIVTAAEPPQFLRTGSKVKLIVWLSQRFESPQAIQERCAPLLQAVPELEFAGDRSPAMVVLRALFEKEVVVCDSRGLRLAKVSLAQSVEKHLDVVTAIQ